MPGLNFANGLRERMITLCCLAFVGSASIGVASRAEAQTATAEATGMLSTNAAGWSCDTGTVTATGGNYSSALGSPLGLTAHVDWGVSPFARIGNMSLAFTFTAVPNPDGSIPLFTYNYNFTAYAETESEYQQAHAWVHHLNPLLGPDLGGNIDATADVDWLMGPGSEWDPESGTLVGPGSVATATLEVLLLVDAEELGVAAPVGGAPCSVVRHTYNSPVLKGKSTQRIRLSNGHTDL